jgi:GPH family glycoside/pentoside/hexuronide:cation symporter
LVHQIANRQKFSLGAGFFTTSFINQSLMVLAVPFYQMTLGVDPFLLSVVLVVPFILASTLNPWVGRLSDNFYSRWGRRRPFIFIAAWVCGILYGLVWMVPAHWAANYQLMYFALTSFLLYCAYVFLNLPMTCLSYEISTHPQTRLALMGVTTYFVKLGTLLFQWLFPLAQLAIFSSVFLGIKVVGWTVGLIVIAVLGMLPAIFCREREHVSSAESRSKFTDTFAIFTHNKKLFALLLICVIQLAGGAFSASMDYYLLVYYVHGGDLIQGSIDKGWLSTAYTLLGMLAIPLLVRWSAKQGNAKVLQGVFILTALGGVAKWFLFVPNIGMWLLLDAILCTVIWSAMSCVFPAMLAELSDDHSAKTRQYIEGRYVAIYTLVANYSAALAILLAGLCVTVSGFDASLGAEQSSSSLNVMRIILAGGTVLFSLLAWLILSIYLRKNKE